MRRSHAWSSSSLPAASWSAAVSLADVALPAYTRLAREGVFDMEAYPAIRRWIGQTGSFPGLSAAR